MEDIILTEKSIIVLNKNVAIRYEHNLEGGTLILIDTNRKKIKYLNKESKVFIDEIKNRNNPKTIGELYSEILSEYNGYPPEEVINSVNSLINNLYEDGFIEIQSI